MRSKILLSTVCMAASLWAAGCQHRNSVRKQAEWEPSPCNLASTPFPTAPEKAPEKIADTTPAPASTDGPRSKTVIITPDQPVSTNATPPATLPWADKKPATPVELPRAAPAPLKAATPKPAEAPLPPPSLPDSLPAPSANNLDRSKHEEFVLGSPATSTDSFRTLTGEVQQFRRGWRLRYAGIDVMDAHGGSVALVGPGLERLREGSRVRVTGNLIPAEDRLGTARFQVQSVDVLEQ